MQAAITLSIGIYGVNLASCILLTRICKLN